MRTSLLLTFVLLGLATLLLSAFGLPQAVAAQEDVPFGKVFLPFLEKPIPPTPTPTATTPPAPAPTLQPRETPTLPPSANEWRLIEKRRLTPCENLGKHNIFIKVIDEEGNPVDDRWLVQVAAGTTGPALDVQRTGSKGPGMAEFVMWKNAYYDVYVVADPFSSQPASSDIAEWVHSNFTDEEMCPDADGGNTLYHNSFNLIFQHAAPATATPTPTETPDVTPDPGATATPTPTSTPTPSGNYEFSQASVVGCDPQAGGTWFDGTVYKHGQPANGYRVVFSWQPDGAWCTNPAISGPHDGYPYWNPGYYSHIIQSGSPREGDWWVWVVNEAGVRISEMAQWHSTGPGEGGCNEATINFDS